MANTQLDDTTRSGSELYKLDLIGFILEWLMSEWLLWCHPVRGRKFKDFRKICEPSSGGGGGRQPLNGFASGFKFSELPDGV